MGLTGLANLGNTCFVNATLQCLSHTYELNEFLDSKDKWENKLQKKPESLILLEWNQLRNMMWSENCIISPAGFIQAVQKVAQLKGRDLFVGYSQNDFTEFLEFIINSFHSAIEREVDMEISGKTITKVDKIAKICYNMMKNMYKKEYSDILGLFYGIHISKTNTLTNEYENMVPEPFFNLSVEVNNKTNNLIDCLRCYTAVEKLDGDNQILNDKTNKKEDGEKRILFFQLPEILVITLKRFSNDGRKNNKVVNFPLNDLNMEEFMIGYDKKSYVYDLYGISNHSGGVQGGHYTSYIKMANGEWYHFNDTMIQKVENVDELKSHKAYCFFYRKKK